MRTVSLALIAKACGVSTSAVSLALRDHPRIPPRTRQRIKAAARRLKYEPNRAVSRVMSEIRRPLRLAYKETLAYLITEGTPSKEGWEPAVYSGVLERAAQIGYGIERVPLSPTTPNPKAISRMLRSRGIRGVIVAPFPQADAHLNLDWKHFAAVTIGYTLASPRLHRVTRDLSHDLREIYYQLTRSGYRRIGLILDPRHEQRLRHTVLSSFLLYHWELDEARKVPPLVLREAERPPVIQRWLREHRPDVVLTMEQDVRERMISWGYRIPQDIGFFSLNLPMKSSGITGIYADFETVGRVAVEQVSNRIEHDNFGIPERPHTVMIPGVWRAGETALLRRYAGRNPRQ